MSKTDLPKLCIVSLYSYPLFNPDCRSLFGGSEVRISLIARELARRGRFKVSMVVFNHGQPHVEDREGITFYTHRGYALVLPVLPPLSDSDESQVDYPAVLSWKQKIVGQGRHLFRQLRAPAFRLGRRMYRAIRLGYNLLRQIKSMLQAVGYIGPYPVEKSKVAIYDEVDADIYLLHGNSNMAAELAFYCQQRGKKYVFLASSDGDYQPSYKEQPNVVAYYGSVGHLLVYAIEHATAHIVQSERQAELLRKHYGRSSVIIRNPVDLTRLLPQQVKTDTILWIGKSDRVKQPDMILTLARQLPGYRFVMIMNLSDQQFYEHCLAEAKKLSNVTIAPYVPYNEVEQYFIEARLLVNTSTFEGFPNTFLQAAKYGVPIVSLQVDPGAMLSQHGCGLLSDGNFKRLQENVCLLMTTPILYAEKGAKCLDYVRVYHDKDRVIEEYEKALASILAPVRKG